ncbi:MAG: 16S rRNA (guanine(966)-N(2))-methyltransferase RsmD [Candidatus Tectomicrobia bacterium]|uniref:16S rRNA (Guanine(966)-N(2))-methyltransferase RsmD n=1 Tax=Tectimicrobiota bacterium TaxID=2528274 RepID=A0A932GQY3_UNCTE|nr:16S rRNA (guanine(966)-N(2))-methyltransferase RsmD [Candidatus Tectomicrobia bacterium]
MLRVITGSAKGRKLKVPRGHSVRPTPEIARGALFNILGETVTGSRFLDLFAGSGSIGIEALSRGASYAAFVELNPSVCKILAQNLERCGFTPVSRIYSLDAVAFLPILLRSEAPFDVVFLDPPYEGTFCQKFLTQLPQYDIVTDTGLVVAQHFFKCKELESFSPYHLQRRQRFGDTVLSFFSRS